MRTGWRTGRVEEEEREGVRTGWRPSSRPGRVEKKEERERV